MRENYTLKRLYCEQSLVEGSVVVLSKAQAHYIGHVLRMSVGETLRLFNGQDGDWLGTIISLSKKSVNLRLISQIRPPKPMPDISLAFAPIRRHRTAFIFEKGTELGVSAFQPVITARTQFPKLNLERAQLQIIEAAEQTERLDIPLLHAPVKFFDWLGSQSDRQIAFADEGGDADEALDICRQLEGPATLLIGPEGGFTDEERGFLKEHSNVVAVSLGPRILRADTAALSLLTLWQAAQGDWGERLG